MQCGRVSQRNTWQVAAVYLDYRKVGQRIGADQLGLHDLSVAHGDADVDCAINHVVIGDDVAVGRNNDSAADAMLNLRLLAAMTEALTLAETWSEELLHVVG